MKKWKIYIIGHKKIHDLTVKCDRDFNNDNYTFLNVGNQDSLENQDGYSVIKQSELANSISIGKYWAESEGIYNIWRSGVYKELDYIGFIHYDVQLKLDKKFVIGSKTNITKRINKYIDNKDRGHISFATFTPKGDFAQKIMMDENEPNTLVGDGRNCYYEIINDYNQFFGTSHTVEEFMLFPKINLCSCFLIDTAGFEKMMGFFEWLYESHKLDKFDTEHKNRFQGGMAERYFGVFLMFEYDKMKDLNLNHMWDAGWK